MRFFTAPEKGIVESHTCHESSACSAGDRQAFWEAYVGVNGGVFVLFQCASPPTFHYSVEVCFASSSFDIGIQLDVIFQKSVDGLGHS